MPCFVRTSDWMWLKVHDTKQRGTSSWKTDANLDLFNFCQRISRLSEAIKNNINVYNTLLKTWKWSLRFLFSLFRTLIHSFGGTLGNAALPLSLRLWFWSANKAAVWGSEWTNRHIKHQGSLQCRLVRSHLELFIQSKGLKINCY